MAILLPVLPQGTTITFALNSNALDLTPSLGGPVQRIARLGDKWSIQFALRPLSYADAFTLLASLNQGLTQKLQAVIPQQWSIGSPGNAIGVASGSQLGTSVVLTGFPAGYEVKPGQFFNIATNGITYLYQVTAAQIASSSGTMTVPINPMLKASPNAGDYCNFFEPVIEGWLQGTVQQAAMSLTNSVTIGFTIKEAV